VPSALPAYQALLAELGLYDKKRRGSGILTAVASLALGWIEPRPASAILTAVNALGSDTDTIATMTGAILGATAPDPPPGPILDSDVIQQTADRLTDLAAGLARPGHTYPDLLNWLAPRTQADGLLQGRQAKAVAGLGPVRDVISDPIPGPAGDVAWQWIALASGQTLLIKRRGVLPRSPDETATPEDTAAHGQRRSADHKVSEAVRAPDARHRQRAQNRDRGTALELDTILSWLQQRGYKDDAVGYAVRRVITEGSPEQLIALVSTLRERLRQQDQPQLFG
jgi:hypothetical protein